LIRKTVTLGMIMNTFQIVCRIEEDEGEMALLFEVMVDDVPLLDYDEYAVDLQQLSESLVGTDGEYFIVTCSCGDAACAGIMQGVNILHQGGNIHWQMCEPKNAEFTFDAKQCANELNKSCEDGLGIASENQQLVISPTSNSYFLNHKFRSQTSTQ